MTTLIHGASGAQGAPIRSLLEDRGSSVLAATRADGIDMSSADSVRSAYSGAERVFIHLPMASPQDVSLYVDNILAGLADSRLSRAVVSTSGKFLDEGHPLSEPADSPLRRLIDGLQGAGVSTAVLQPRLFLENLLLPPVAEGVRADATLRYPLRADFPVAWTSHLDVADVVVALLDRVDVVGTVGIGQSPAIVGDVLAAAVGERLSREVVYEAVAPQAFGALIAPLVGEQAAAGVAGLYSAFATVDGLPRALADHDAESLGHVGRTPAQWLSDIAY